VEKIVNAVNALSRFIAVTGDWVDGSCGSWQRTPRRSLSCARGMAHSSLPVSRILFGRKRLDADLSAWTSRAAERAYGDRASGRFTRLAGVTDLVLIILCVTASDLSCPCGCAAEASVESIGATALRKRGGKRWV